MRRQARRVGRVVALVLAGAVGSLHGTATDGRDPIFSQLPFAKWVAEGRQSGFRWSVQISPAELSTHQRLMLRVATHVDGRDLEKRRGAGDFLSLVQMADSAGRIWQNHSSVDLEKMQPGMQAKDLLFTHYVFVLPGDYTVTVAVCDTLSLQHSVTVRKVHVAALRTDPLPESWRGLPPVEFIPPTMEPPDVWYLPELSRGLNLTVKTVRAVHIQVVVNTTPSERTAGSVGAMRRNMSVVVPALKILSQLRIENGSMDVALLDLTHRKVVFEQKDVGPQRLDWDGIRRFFQSVQPGIIDVKALEGRWRMRKFFWDQVTRRLGLGPLTSPPPAPLGAVPIVIVLSGASFMEDQEPVEPAGPAADPQRRLFYIRYRPVLPRNYQARRTRPGMRPTPLPQVDMPLPIDDLERTVEPLDARFFDAASAEQFRRVLAAVLEQIGRF